MHFVLLSFFTTLNAGAMEIWRWKLALKVRGVSEKSDVANTTPIHEVSAYWKLSEPE